MHATGDFGFGFGCGFGFGAAVVMARVVEGVECVVALTDAVAFRFAGFFAAAAAVAVGVLAVVGVVVVDAGVTVDWLIVTRLAAWLLADLPDPPHPVSSATLTPAASRQRQRLTGPSHLAGDGADQFRRGSTTGPVILLGGCDRARWRRG
jgi:hypothetical protein